MKVKNIRRTDTKKRIEESFTALLRKRDIEGITIKNITNYAKINRATFYAHYEDKYQLFDEMIKESASNKIDVYTKHINKWNNEQVLCLTQAIFEYLNEVKINCPYSYQNLFPLLRKKMLMELKQHLITLFSRMDNTKKNQFEILIYSRVIYDAAEVIVTEETNLTLHEVVKEINTLIDNNKEE
ncbi:TetR/AcrR family transcriptional regulator [Cytobacillus horneckiae]|uniref:TetR/AcrR family transcriptional regulator n=1 Tax=Cytobacillus horneckiae TaxID=549687 RepID=UPI003D9A0CE8